MDYEIIYSSAGIGSVVFQLFIFWLISSFFSKKKKKGNLVSLFKSFVKNISNKIEKSINELEIVSDESIHFQTESVPKANNSYEPIKPQVIKKEKLDETSFKSKTKIREKLGLHSKSTLKNAIILNEIIGKPVSLRR